MAGDYSILASIYDKVGMGNFTRDFVPHLVNYALSNGWMGRRIIDIGTGTGAGLEWLAEHGYILTGVDASAEMLNIARKNDGMERMNVNWMQQDFREPIQIDNIEMAICINTLNELDSLRDLETVFKNIHKILRETKLFTFDLHTIEGLIERYQTGDSIIYNDNELVVFCHNLFDYERQILTRKYIIFQNSEGSWRRYEADQSLRAYPVQGVVALLKRSGFNVTGVLDQSMKIYDPSRSASRVIFMAEKQ